MLRSSTTRFGSLAAVLSLCFILAAAGQNTGNKSTSANPYPSTYKPLPRSDTFITNATILDGLGHRLENASIQLHDGKIIAIGPNLKPTVKRGGHRWTFAVDYAWACRRAFALG